MVNVAPQQQSLANEPGYLYSGTVFPHPVNGYDSGHSHPGRPHAAFSISPSGSTRHTTCTIYQPTLAVSAPIESPCGQRTMLECGFANWSGRRHKTGNSDRAGEGLRRRWRASPRDKST